MKARTTVIAGIVLGAMALAPAAHAKGTMYLVGATNVVGSQAIAENGALSPIGTTATGNTPRSGAITPDATKLYVSNFGGGNISAYTIGAGGILTPVAGSPFAADTNTEGLAITPNGTFLYAANTGANNVTGYSIAAGGALVPVTGSPFTVPNVKGVAVSANGAFLFATTDAGVRVYAIDQTTGALSVVGGTTAAGTGPKGLAVTPDGRFLYVGNITSANLFGYSIGADGSLTPVGSPAPTGNVPFTVAVSADGRFVYAANSGSGSVTAYAIGTDGALSAVPGQPFPAGTEPYGVDAAPNARQVYVSNRVSNDVNAYDVGADGALAQLAGSPFAANATNLEYQSITITPNQGPTALFTGGVVAGKRGGGQTAEFSGSSSSDSDGGTIASYTWDFGDGSAPETTTSPTVSHTYAAAGDYQVSLTVTDDEGCSNQQLFTGQTVDCNGSSAARITQTVQVSGADTPPDLKLKGKKQKLARKVTVKAKTADDTDAVAKGKLKIKKKGKSNEKGYSLKKATKSLDAGEKTKLKPKLSKKAYKKAKKALKNGGKVTAKVKVKVTDSDADTDKDSVKVKLKKP